MLSKIKNTAITFFLILLASQCSVGLKIPTSFDAQKSGNNLEALIEGRNLYIGNCGSCHGLYLPEKFTAAQWTEKLEKMKKKAKINDEQSSKVFDYLTSYCKVEN